MTTYSVVGMPVFVKIQREVGSIHNVFFQGRMSTCASGRHITLEDRNRIVGHGIPVTFGDTAPRQAYQFGTPVRRASLGTTLFSPPRADSHSEVPEQIRRTTAPWLLA
jgi:hypothetical protein